MKNNFCLIAALLIFISCNSAGASIIISNKNGFEKKFNPGKDSVSQDEMFTLSDAEKIMGEKAQLTDSSTEVTKDALIYKCSYTANSTDPKTGKIGAVYFMLEQYEDIASAEKVYASIKKSNEDQEGIKVLPDLGNEAYFHSDYENFYFIIVRKGSNIFRMKVNKITSMTSLDEFNNISRNIAGYL